MNFIWYILIGIIAGYVAGKITRGGGFGLLVTVSYTHLTLPTNSLV